MESEREVLQKVVDGVLGAERSHRLFQLLTIPVPFTDRRRRRHLASGLSQALNMILFDDLLARVPDANQYAADCLKDGRKIMHDHGAVRTVAMTGMGSLPAEEAAITRILKHLGMP